MKMKQEHYQVIKDAIAKLNRGDIFVHAEMLKQDTRVKDLAMRLRWDCFYATGIRLGDGIGCDGLPVYAYCHDEHVDTALRQIMKDLHILC